jgi:hypothetical protein
VIVPPVGSKIKTTLFSDQYLTLLTHEHPPQ